MSWVKVELWWILVDEIIIHMMLIIILYIGFETKKMKAFGQSTTYIIL